MNHENITAREILAHLAIKNRGEWAKIRADVQTRAQIPPEDVAKSIEGSRGFVTILDSDGYPQSLTAIPQPPFVLFFEGDVDVLKTPSDRILSVAGDRAASDYGLSCAERMGKACAERGIVLCAKVARGCGSTALRACAKAGGKCIGVMSGGIDRPYPNRKDTEDTVADILASGGVVVSEYPDGTDPQATAFALSSRVVAALCKALYVPQMKKTGGTAMTVAFALNGGKDVGAAPFEAGTPDVANNGLIEAGAILVDDVDAFLTETYHGRN